MHQAAEPAVAPPPGNPRFPLFDGLRAIAALAVLGYHSAFRSGADQTDGTGQLLSHLNIGVPIFFVISGFLLYRPFVASRLEHRPGPRVAGYARRRFLRIVPAYWVALTLLAIWPGLRGVFTGDWWVYYGFAQVYESDTVLNGIAPAWTLGTELLFYALLPLYALLAARLSVRSELALLGVLAALAIACRTLAQGGDVGGPVLMLGLPGTFDWFAVGMAFAVLSAAGWRVGNLLGARPVLMWLGAAALYGVLSFGLGLPRGYVFVQQYTYFQSFAEHVLSGLIAGLLVAPAVFRWQSGGPPRRLLALPVVGWLGLISYGIYLWHYDVISLLREWGIAGFAPLTLASLAVVVPIAALSYYLVERPALRLKDGFGAARRRDRRAKTAA